MQYVVAALVLALVGGCMVNDTFKAGSMPTKEKLPATVAPTVARVCRSGEHLFRYADGTVRTSFGYLVTEPDLTKVCE